MSEAWKAGGCHAPDGRAAQFAGEFAAVRARRLIWPAGSCGGSSKGVSFVLAWAYELLLAIM